MAWIALILAGLSEIAWAFAMKESQGFTRLWPSISAIVGMVVSVTLLAFSMKSLPLGTAYALWTGIGAVGAFVVGILFLGEPVSATRIAAGLLIVSGMVLMKLG